MHHAEIDDTTSRDSVAVSEAARLLELCVDQIKAAVDEAFPEIDALARSFLDTARHANALLGTLSDQNTDGNSAAESVLADSRALQQALQDASMRLQFADRLDQRLSNVSKNLAGLAELMQAADLPTTDIEWSGFLNRTRATFTMEHERQMFDAMFGLSAAGCGTEPATDASQGPTVCDGEASSDG